MLQIENTSSLLSSYHPLSHSIIIKGKEPPVIAMDIYKEYGNSKGFSAVSYPLPNPSQILYFYTVDMGDEIIDCQIDDFTQIFSPEEIDTHSFFCEGQTVSFALNRLVEHITINVLIQKNIPIFAPLLISDLMQAQKIICNGISLSRSNSVANNSFIQSNQTLLFRRELNGFDAFSGEIASISAVITLENPKPKAKILLFDISQKYCSPNIEQSGDTFELTNDLNQPFTTEDYSPAKVGEVISPPDYIDNVTFLGETFFVDYANAFSPTIGNMFFTSTKVKLFTSIYYASSISSRFYCS